jgi:hypothetical protein
MPGPGLGRSWIAGRDAETDVAIEIEIEVED